jgi:succinate-semialdehyde dehydrogenase/glutarate-semialdehyde dehydrogenase
VTYAAEFFRWFAAEAERSYGRWSTGADGGSRTLVLRQPVGPCVLITPWNFPLAMAARKIAPALAAGCTSVLKPAGLTPLTSLLFADVLDRAGTPPGVVNVVTTSRSGAVIGPLLADPRTRKLSFTGSTEVGRQLLAEAADGVLRVSMELGGNAPFLVFADADLDAAIEGALVAKLRNMGEACTAANRFLVEAPVAEEFAQAFAARLKGLVVGPGTEPGVDIGPLVDRSTRDKVAALVSDARERGAVVLAGGSIVDSPGWFFEPTVLARVPHDARCVTEEVFGPVAPIVSFESEQQAIALANDTEYGLAAYAYTHDLDRTIRLAESLRTGMLAVNRGLLSDPAAPFGGVKSSGLGREGSVEGLSEYQDTVYVAIDHRPRLDSARA